MVKRNTELNEQAMKAFANKGKAPPATPEGKDPVDAGKEKVDPVKQAKMADELATAQGKLPADMTSDQKKEMMEVMKLANEMERQEEEAMIKKAMEASQSNAERDS